MSYWRYDPETRSCSGDSGPQLAIGVLVLAALTIRVYFGVNCALAFAGAIAAVVVAGAAIAWLPPRGKRAGQGNAGTGT